jgi:hypothetical protein
MTDQPKPVQATLADALESLLNASTLPHESEARDKVQAFIDHQRGQDVQPDDTSPSKPDDSEPPKTGTTKTGTTKGGHK